MEVEQENEKSPAKSDDIFNSPRKRIRSPIEQTRG